MHEQPTRGPGTSPLESDEQLRDVVLIHLLDLYPAQLTTAEVILELGGEVPSSGERDDLERAVRDLRCAGLVHRRGDMVWASRAAVAAGVLRAN